MIHHDTSHKTTFLKTSPTFLSLWLFSIGSLYRDCCLPAFLLLGVLLLGADGGVAVLPGRHWQNEVTTHSQAFSVPRLGWVHTIWHITAGSYMLYEFFVLTYMNPHIFISRGSVIGLYVLSLYRAIDFPPGILFLGTFHSIKLHSKQSSPNKLGS